MHRFRIFAALLSIAAVIGWFGTYSKNSAEAATQPQQEQGSAAPQLPSPEVTSLPGSDDTQGPYGPSFAYLAWNLFLEAMTPTNGSPTFESWTEQCELTPGMVGCPSAARMAALAAKAGPNGRARILHGNVGSQPRKFAGNDCSAMTAKPVGGYPAPSNLTPNATFCEEVFVSPAEASFVKRNLATLVSQRTYGNARNGTINFPGTETNDIRPTLDSLEIKLDWVPSSSFKPTFACPDPTDKLYTETIDGTCYALAAVHITSKVMPNWLWATFEPASNITNPNRCDPSLYGACFDPWGTTWHHPYGKRQTAQQSPELRHAMAEAHLSPALSNYFLTGVQTLFVDTHGRPIQLGNSFVEFNQGVPPGKSSCITCHQYAAFDGKPPSHAAPENNFGRPPDGWPSIGFACNQNQTANCTPAAPNATGQDFSWILGLMPYSDAPADNSDSSAKLRSLISAPSLTP